VENTLKLPSLQLTSAAGRHPCADLNLWETMATEASFTYGKYGIRTI
jgi:hypothetical protein